MTCCGITRYSSCRNGSDTGTAQGHLRRSGPVGRHRQSLAASHRGHPLAGFRADSGPRRSGLCCARQEEDTKRVSRKHTEVPAAGGFVAHEATRRRFHRHQHTDRLSATAGKCQNTARNGSRSKMIRFLLITEGSSDAHLKSDTEAAIAQMQDA